MPSSASASWSRLPRSGPLARSAILRGSRSPAISACTIATTDLAFMPVLRHRGDLHHGVFQQLLQPLQAAGPLPDQVGPGPGEVPHRPDRGRRHETGPQHPPLGQPGQPHRVQLVRLRPPLEVFRLRRGHQLDRQPGAFQHVIPHTPVIGRALQRHHLHPAPEQLPAQLGDPRPHRRHVLPDPVHEPARALRVRGPHAHHPGRLGHIHRGHPLIHDLVILIRDHLRLAHRTLLSWNRSEDQRAARGSAVSA